MLSGMDDAENFYFDVLRQVRLNRWCTGRVVLTGDAAWCVTPIAGMGVKSLAILALAHFWCIQHCEEKTGMCRAA